MAAKTDKAPAASNGQPTVDPLAQAIAYEQQIADEAAAVWAKDENADREIDRWLYNDLRPLLRMPIPSGFIEHVGEVTGKPYPSSGVKSVQVQMDRLDNVLGPMYWGYEATYSEEGKLCHVRAWIGEKDSPLIERDSYGGVKQGSSLGNIYKGSFTNAAKLALARLGPAWEVYVGAADFDPDTDEDAAKEQAKADPVANVPTIDGDRVAHLTDLAQGWVTDPDDPEEQKKRTKQVTRLMRSEGLTGEIKSVTQGFARLTPGMADNVEAWLAEQKGGQA